MTDCQWLAAVKVEVVWAAAERVAAERVAAVWAAAAREAAVPWYCRARAAAAAS